MQICTLTQRKGKQCGFGTTYSKGTLAIFSQRAIVSRRDKIAESLFITYILNHTITRKSYTNFGASNSDGRSFNAYARLMA